MALDYDKTTDLMALLDRTRLRNAALYVPVVVTGIDAAILSYAETLDAGHIGNIENMIAMVEGEVAVKEFQADKDYEADYLALENEQTILDEKMSTEAAKLALKQELEDYVQTVRLYDNAVKAMLQSAREFAAEVDREGVTLEKLRAMLAVRKEEVKVVQLNSEIALEKYRAAEVEVDIIKAQLEVIRANLKIIQANINIKEAEVKEAETTVALAMTGAESATLAADIATVLAEIETKSIAAIRYQSEKSELAAEKTAGLGRFTAQSAIVSQQQATAIIVEGMIKSISEMIVALTALEIASENLRMVEQVEVPREILAQESTSGAADAAAESAGKIVIATERLKPTTARITGETAVSQAHAWQGALLAEARAEVKKLEATQTIYSETRTIQEIESQMDKTTTEKISGGGQTT